MEQTTKASTSNVVDRATMEEKRAISLMHTSEHRDREGEIDQQCTSILISLFCVVFGTHFGGRVKVQVFACCRCFVRGGSGDL